MTKAELIEMLKDKKTFDQLAGMKQAASITVSGANLIKLASSGDIDFDDVKFIGEAESLDANADKLIEEWAKQ
ncbi:MAG: hypothetical protein JXR39_02420 [Marinilabiliaceae bacterium]|nr:hypothetical protein [Marinilabiliaceae bacterium]